MAQTNPLSQLKYGALKNALLCARLGIEYEYRMREELELAWYCSLKLGVPLAGSVEERIKNVYNTACMAEKVIGETDYRELIKPRRRHYRRVLFTHFLA